LPDEAALIALGSVSVETERMAPSLEPILLMADSQMLFWKEHEERFLARVVRGLDVAPQHAKAAYLGASNGDAPEFFELFQAAFADLGFSNCMHVHAEPSAAERAFLAEAKVILLAGGDVDVGYRAFEAAELIGLLRTRRSEGAILMGVSAGAIHMGVTANPAQQAGLALVPYVIDVHDEPAWQRLSASLQHSGGTCVGMGIPTGGAALVHPDLSVETIRKPITEVTLQDGIVHRRELLSIERPSGSIRSQRDRTLN
jgi:peptidase E